MIQETKIALKNAGKIDPLSIDEYLESGGFQGLKKAMGIEPVKILEQISNAGLRGRGGAGFPAGMKGRFTDEAICHYCGPKYLICNADEGEPGTFKDRIIMEQDPFLLIEGMLISALSIGAGKGYIYIRGEYTESIRKLKNAIDQCYKKGFLGKDCLGENLSFELELRYGAGSYLCGEELTLLESLEGKRGYPRIKPPFPAQKGLFDCPTLINNVETFAHVPYIIEHGAEHYKSYGTEKSPGTKIFTVSGDVENPGYVETEMGATLKQIIELCGGMKDKKPFYAALLGGAAGTFVNEEVLQTPMGFDTLKEKDAILGSGAIIVMNQERSIYDIMVSILEFFKHESCGKCVPCRVGTNQLLIMLHRLGEQGNGNRENILEKMKQEAEYMAANSLCPLGASPILPIGSIYKYFKKEF